MKLGIVVNVMPGEVGGQTTYRLAAAAATLGHEVWILGAGSFACDPDDVIRARGRRIPHGSYEKIETLGPALKASKTPDEWVAVDELDVLLLRSNPSYLKPWAQYAGIDFGRLAMRHGVLVLNNPNGLSKALNKLYLQTFPEEVRPATLVTRSSDRLKAFAQDRGAIVIKPLQGSGGKGVFVVQHADAPNTNQMIDAVSRDGYVVAQEYLPEAAEGDTRLFLMNGRPLMEDGKYAAFRRVRTGGDLRSNVEAGGKLRRATVDDSMLALAEMVRPRLIEDGMFLVGLDIVGSKLLEINVFSPGGLGSAQLFEKVDLCAPIIRALESKVKYMESHPRSLSSIEMATL